MEIMFDLETLDTRASAVVLSIGAVAFERDGTIVDRFEQTLDIQRQLDAGRTVSQATLLWWLEDGMEEARAKAFRPDNRGKPGVVLMNFRGWAQSFQVDPVTGYWSKSPWFDAVIWESLGALHPGVGGAPWGFRDLRAVRTICEEAGVPRRFGVTVALRRDQPGYHRPPGGGAAHTPVYDCEVQVVQVTEARRLLGLATRGRLGAGGGGLVAPERDDLHARG